MNEFQLDDLNKLQPWQWPDEHWRSLVNQVRAGRPLRPSSWKDGKHCAVAISFDSDHETNELREGGRDIGAMSWGEYGSRVGVPRILEVLRRHDVKASFFVPAVSALLHEDEQRSIVAEGHEVAMHGWIHELCAPLCYEDERDLMLRSADTLERITGVRPVGLRTPSLDFSPNTLRISREMGLFYDSSMASDDDCYELLLNGQETGLVEVPVERLRSDSAYFLWWRGPAGLRPHTPPADVLDIFLREFDAAYEAGGVFQLTLHPHIITPRSRIWILDELLRHARAKGDCWFATHAEIAAFVKAN